MKSDDRFEFDVQLFSSAQPVDGGGDEFDDELPPDDEEPVETGAPVGEEIVEEEMPDDLLTPEEKEVRNRERAASGAAEEPVGGAPAEDRSTLATELRSIFGEVLQQTRAERQPERDEATARSRAYQPFKLSPEKEKELTEKILSEEGGVARAIAAAINIGERRALQQMAKSPEGQASMQAAAETFADRFVAKKMRDPGTKYGKLTEPVFQAMLDEFDLTPLTSMNAAARQDWFESTWERATGRALTSRSAPKPAPSPGVARGAGSRPGSPGKSRVVIRLKQSEKDSIYKSLPNNDDGRRKAARQIWEIEHGVTSDRGVQRAVGESMRFAEAVTFGG